MSQITEQLKVYGIDDSVHECDCCGKTNLKSTVVVEVDGEFLHYGSVCATRHTGKESKVIRSEAKAATEARRQVARQEYQSHPALAIYREKMEQARKARLLGLAFIEFCATEREAEELALSLIAQKHGFQPHQIWA